MTVRPLAIALLLSAGTGPAFARQPEPPAEVGLEHAGGVDGHHPAGMHVREPQLPAMPAWSLWEDELVGQYRSCRHQHLIGDA